jgi:type I restriction enzyme S subunit
MSELKEINIGSLGKVITGNTPPTTNRSYYGGPYPFIKPTDMDKDSRYVKSWEETYSNLAFQRYRKSYIPKGAIGVVTIGTVGEKIFQADRPCFTNQSVNVVIPHESYDENFVYYLLKFNLFKVFNANPGTASGRDHVSKSNFCSIKVTIPSDKIKQQRIGLILSSYDELIENNNRRMAILEQMAENIYKEWFVRMRFPGFQTTEVEKGVPKGWLKELKNYITVVKGKSYTGEEINEDGDGKAFVNLKSFNRGGGYRYDGIKFYTGKYHQKQIVREGDIVMAVTDMTQDRVVVGRVARIPKTQYPEMVISLDAAKIIPKDGLPNSFFYAMLRFGFFGTTLKEFANGANVLHLKPEIAYKMKSIIPDDKLLIHKFNKIIEPFFNLIDNLNLENQNLRTTRDLLLPRLISGKLRVKNLEQNPVN